MIKVRIEINEIKNKKQEKNNKSELYFGSDKNVR